MPNSESRKPGEVLREILAALQSGEPEARLNAIAQLHAVNYSSEAIRNQLEKLAVQDPNEDVRKEALYTLDLATQKHVRNRLNNLNSRERRILAQEILEWEKLGLLEKENADVLRRRYDFDITPPAKPKIALYRDDAKPVSDTVEEAVEIKKSEEAAHVEPAAPAETTAAQSPTPVEVKETAAAQISAPVPVPPIPSRPKPAPQPAGPRPTLLQTLLSETSIKIALYLGAFFVISSAAILAALYQVARLPILIIATLIFGGIAVATRKRLPQPSFALFIVFSYLLPITANVLEESLALSPPFRAAYWVFISTVMALIWAGGTWLYESRLFSLTSFVSFVVALYRIGDIFDAAPEFYAVTLGIAALTGLAGTWTLKQWKDAKFALPLFLSAQLLQVIVCGTAATVYFTQFVSMEPSAPLWNLAHIFTWGFAFAFYAFSNFLFPFILFPWLAAATLFTIPWSIGVAFELKEFAGTLIFVIWSFILAASSEVIQRLEMTRKYSLPILLVSILTAWMGIIVGFIDNETTGFSCALGFAVIFAALHLIRPRGGLWAVSLFNFIIAYFTFFYLPFMEEVKIFFGYELLGLSLLFLLPDLFLKNDLKVNWNWRLPLRIYGALFTVWGYIVYSLVSETPLINTAVMFGVYAVFFAVYALRYNTAIIGYLSATALAISATYLLNHFELDIVLESLSVLSAIYFFGGFALKKNESRTALVLSSVEAWRIMLEASGLILGGIVSLVALFTGKEYTGWFIAMIGALFMIQMYSRKQHLFEIGAHFILCIAVYLILNDFRITESSYTIMAFSLVILSLDMLFAFTFKHPRPLETPVKTIGGILTLVASLIFFAEQNDLRTSIGFAIYTAFFFLYTAAQRNAVYGYVPAAYLPLAIYFTLDHFNVDAWLPALTGLAVIYFIIGFALCARESWSPTPALHAARQRGASVMRNSALILGTLISLGALIAFKETGGWYIAVISLLFIAEMHIRRQGMFEIGAQVLLPAALYLILRDFKLVDYVYILLGCSLIWLGLDLIFSRTFKESRPLEWIIKAAGGLAALAASIGLPIEKNSAQAAIGFGIYTVFFAIYTAVQRKAVYGYLPAAYLPLTIFFALDYFNVDAWLPALTGLAVIYFIIGFALLARESSSLTPALHAARQRGASVMRNSALILGTLIALGTLVTFKETGGWYALVVGLLFAAEMYLSRNGLFEVGLPVMFNIGAFLILHDFYVTEIGYHLLAYSLVWLLTDLLAHLTFTNPRQLQWAVRGIGAALALVNYGILFLNADSKVAAVGFGVYALLFLMISLLYRQPSLFYIFTVTLPLFAAFLFREFDLNKWIHPVIVIAVIYYALGYAFRAMKRYAGWDMALLFSGLGIGIIVSAAAPILGGVDAAIPVALAATLWAAEAFARRNAWLGFPANGLYLLAYFIILIELNVGQPQFFSIGAALLGMIQHYLLTRAGSKTGAFIMGMVSQLVLLGTTYIQMVNTEQLSYFFALFFQSIVVIFYGVVIRSRSLTFAPIGIVVLGVITVLYSTLKGISTVILVGCSGVILLMLGILAVVMRERITKISEKLSDWQA